MVAVFVISGSTTMSLAESKLTISDDEDISFGPFDSDTSVSVPSGMEQLSSAQPTHGELLIVNRKRFHMPFVQMRCDNVAGGYPVLHYLAFDSKPSFAWLFQRLLSWCFHSIAAPARNTNNDLQPTYIVFNYYACLAFFLPDIVCP